MRDGAQRLYFRAVGEPLGESSLTSTIKEKRPSKNGLGRSDRVRTCDLQYPKLARYQLRYTSIYFFSLSTLENSSSPELAQIPVRSHSCKSALAGSFASRLALRTSLLKNNT